MLSSRKTKPAHLNDILLLNLVVFENSLFLQKNESRIYSVYTDILLYFFTLNKGVTDRFFNTG